MRSVILLSLIASLLAGCGGSSEPEAAESSGPAAITYEATWESLKRYEPPKWFQDAKFGIFIHWGPYAVPAFGNEWYPRRMYLSRETGVFGEVKSEDPDICFVRHTEEFGPQSEFGYKDFIPLFKAEAFDAGEWAGLFARSGARYVVPVAEHHDGFAMYASSVTEWNSKEMGPEIDVARALKKAVETRGMRFGLSSHFAYNRSYFTRSEDFDTADPRFQGLYGEMRHPKEPPSAEFMELWYTRTKDIIDTYKPEVLWFDFGVNVPEFQPYLQRLAAYYYNHSAELGREPVLLYKDIFDGSFPKGAAVLDIERGRLNDIRDLVWQTDTSISKKSWGYIEDDEFKTANELVDVLIDIVSKNGCLLLNVGPRADGVIPSEAQEILLEIGRWLERNGDAIYESRPWRIYGEGPTRIEQGHFSENADTGYSSDDIRFTTRGDKLNVIALGWPGAALRVAALAAGSPHESRAIASVRLLGSEGTLEFSQDAAALTIQLPDNQVGDHAHVFQITFESL